MTICDIGNAVITPYSFFSAINVRGHYLTVRDTYNMKTKSVTSSKPRIEEKLFKNSTDSNDVLSADVASLLSTQLVQQTPLYNVGLTKMPEEFNPESTPTFQIKFSRDDRTKGYLGRVGGATAYTIDSMLYEYSFGGNSNRMEESLRKE